MFDGLLVDGLQDAFTPALDGLIAAGAVTYDAFLEPSPTTPLLAVSSAPQPINAILLGSRRTGITPASSELR